MASVITMLEDMKKSKTETSSDMLNESVQSNILAAAIGAGVGLTVGYFRSYNLFTSALVGMIGGALISNLLISKK